MKEFSFSDLSRMVGQIVDTAMAGPIALTKHGRRKLVMLPADEYDRLLAKVQAEAPAEASGTRANAKLGETRLSLLRGLGDAPETD